MIKIGVQTYIVNGINYYIRSAIDKDAAALSDLRLQIDGETENMDRERGENFLDSSAFERLILTDSESPKNLFLVAEAEGRLVGFSRCEGSALKRLAHKVDFGVCVLKDYWGCGIGTNLLKQSLAWADDQGVAKVALQVLETNDKAIALYKRLGFEEEGLLRNDKLLGDGRYYNTVVMGRLRG